MFSGLVETIGCITRIVKLDGCHHFTITPNVPFDDIALGDSIAVNGVCLTVTDFTVTHFHVTAVPETLRLTNLGGLTEGGVVNLERSLKVNSRLGGHFVQGHIDGVGEIMELTPDHSSAWLVKIRPPANLNKYLVNKGYITLDGMSITIIESTADWFTITLIPHTQAVTIAQHYTVSSQINIEVDILGKYVEKMIGAHTDAIDTL